MAIRLRIDVRYAYEIGALRAHPEIQKVPVSGVLLASFLAVFSAKNVFSRASSKGVCNFPFAAMSLLGLRASYTNFFIYFVVYEMQFAGNMIIPDSGVFNNARCYLSSRGFWYLVKSNGL